VLIMVRVEISVESVAGARAAAAGGADRVEMCAGLSDGGLTPSAASIELAAAVAEVHVLIRPRPGDFVYSADDVAVMLRDIAVARSAGAAGVVLGALDGAGELAVAPLAEAAEGLQLTLHRAIDVCADSRRALDEAVSLGFHRVLTSGRRSSALDGAPLIKELAERADGRLDVMACGGVRPANVARVVELTGVRDVHAGLRRPVPGARAGDVSYAGVGVPDGFDHFETDAEAVALLCAALTR
jgi:copper homeostasis protein